MWPNKLSACCSLLLAPGAWAATQPTTDAATSTHRAPCPAAPQIDPLDQSYLSRFVRRTMKQRLAGRAPYEPSYVPPALRNMSCRAAVRLRRDGYLHGAGLSGRMNVLGACAEAALLAVRDRQSGGRSKAASREQIDTMAVEIELIGPAQTVAAGHRGLGIMLDACEPGVHGLGVRLDNEERLLCPSELIALGLAGGRSATHQALEELTRRLEIPPRQFAAAWEKLTFFRFRTCFWYQPTPRDTPVELTRGVILLDAHTVDPEHLDNAVERMGRYLLYRVNSDHLFSYEYDPTRDRYGAGFNWVRQAGATWALLLYARRSQRADALNAATKCIDTLLDMLKPLEIREMPSRQGSRLRTPTDAIFVATPDKRNKLGVTALLLLSLSDHPDAGRYAKHRSPLVRAILSLQRPDGMFKTAFPPALPLSSQDYAPGEALLALAKAYAIQRDQTVADAFERAFRYYRQYFREKPNPPFVPWQSQAFALMSRLMDSADYADFVFEMTDWLASFQLTELNCPWPEMHGGISPYRSGRAGCATAVYLEGFVDAYSLARHRDDAARAERYDKLVRLATRFVLQLQFRPEEAYYVRSLQDAIGGVRRTLSDSRLRVDNTQHGIVALMKVRRDLFGR